MTRRPSIKTALAVSEILWPEFRVVDDLVFFSFTTPTDINLTKWHGRTDIEAMTNHTHIFDLFSNHADLHEEPFFDETHDDFAAACQFGKRWAHAVFAKLNNDFPSRKFRVYYTGKDDPIVRFHQKHEGELFWLDEADLQEEIRRGEILVLDTDLDQQ